MFAGPAGSADFDADPEMIRPDRARIEQAAQQRVFRARDRVQRAGAVEGVSEDRRLRRPRTAAAVLHLDAIGCVARTDDAAGNDLEAALADEASDSGGDF